MSASRGFPKTMRKTGPGGMWTIGGGQAGLAMSYFLREQGREHVVVERGRMGERWRSRRWDSLHFQFPNWSLQRWYPEITFGVNSCFLREDFYRERVCLDGAIDKDVIALTLWRGDELVGVWSGEREVDSLALWGRLVVIAPEHARIGLTRRTIAGMEEAGRQMGAAFIYALVTLKHPYMQQGLEQAGYRLLGFFPGYDRELVAPGVVKRVYQAVYAKLLAPENKVLRPDPKNMTPRTKALYELLFPD